MRAPAVGRRRRWIGTAARGRAAVPIRVCVRRVGTLRGRVRYT